MDQEELNRLQAVAEGTYVPPPREPFDPDADLFGGLSRAKLEVSPSQLSPGLMLRQCYAHTFAAQMVALSPPSGPNAPHGGPWKAVDGGGISEDLVVEICFASGPRLDDRPGLDTLRHVAAMLRLLVAYPVCLTIVSNTALERAASVDRPWMIAFEPLPVWPRRQIALTTNVVAGLATLLEKSKEIAHDDDMSRALSLVDGVWWLPTLAAQMSALWSAAETLMRPGRGRTGEALAKAIRAYIGTSRSEGDRIYQEVARLYYARGNAAHAGHAPDPEDVQASYMIARSILLRAITEGKRPPKLEDIKLRY